MSSAELQGIEDVQFAPTGLHSVAVYWNWIRETSNVDFKEYRIKTRHNVKSNFSLTSHTSHSFIVLNKLPRDKPLLVKIEAWSKDETVLAESAERVFSFINEPNMAQISNDDSIKKSNLVYILVPVGFVVMLLSAGLVVFIVRHKRLQRSFLAFANSHYNIQSGTTTFSEDLGTFLAF